MAGTPAKGFGLLWILRTVPRKSRRIGFHHLGGLEKMLPVLRIIAVFTMVWSVGRGIADEKIRREGGFAAPPTIEHGQKPSAFLIGHGVFGCLVLARRAAQELPLVRKPPDLGAHPKTLKSPEGDT